MIQRIQSLYLLVVVGLLITTMCFPMGYFIEENRINEYPFNVLGVSLDGMYHSTLGLFFLLLLSTIVSFFTILLYKKRMLQVRMLVLNCILLVVFYLVFILSYISLKDGGMEFRINWTLCLPLFSMVLNILAICAINHDEALVRAADRLRP